MQGGMDAAVKLVSSDGKEAKFELNEKDKKQTFKLAKGEDLAQNPSGYFGFENRQNE